MCSGWVTRSHYTVDTRFKCRFNIRTEAPGYRIVSSPPVCDKDVVGVTQAVAAGQRAVRKLLFTELPGEGRSVHRALLLPLGGDGATSCAAMRCVFTRHVALTVTACHRAPGARERKYILAIALKQNNAHWFHWRLCILVKIFSLSMNIVHQLRLFPQKMISECQHQH